MRSEAQFCLPSEVVIETASGFHAAFVSAIGAQDPGPMLWNSLALCTPWEGVWRVQNLIAFEGGGWHGAKFQEATSNRDGIEQSCCYRVLSNWSGSFCLFSMDTELAARLCGVSLWWLSLLLGLKASWIFFSTFLSFSSQRFPKRGKLIRWAGNSCATYGAALALIRHESMCDFAGGVHIQLAMGRLITAAMTTVLMPCAHRCSRKTRGEKIARCYWVRGQRVPSKVQRQSRLSWRGLFLLCNLVSAHAVEVQANCCSQQEVEPHTTVTQQADGPGRDCSFEIYTGHNVKADQAPDECSFVRSDSHRPCELPCDHHSTSSCPGEGGRYEDALLKDSATGNFQIEDTTPRSAVWTATRSHPNSFDLHFELSYKLSDSRDIATDWTGDNTATPQGTVGVGDLLKLYLHQLAPELLLRTFVEVDTYLLEDDQTTTQENRVVRLYRELSWTTAVLKAWTGASEPSGPITSFS